MSGGGPGHAAVRRFADATFAASDGVNLHYRDYPSNGAITGPPVLCLHGLTRNCRDFEDLAPRINALGRRVIAPSQRGRGLSDADPNPERYTPVVYAADMLALLDSLGISEAVFVGTSLGGLMTMIAALQAPHRLAGAVLNDIGPEIDPVGLARIRGYAGETQRVKTWVEAAERCREMNQVAFPRETSEAFWENFARKIFRERAPGCIERDCDPAIARSIAAESSERVDLWPLFEALKPIPTLVIRGKISDILSESTVEEMHRRKPDLDVATVAEVGHAPFMTEPEAWSALRHFLAT